MKLVPADGIIGRAQLREAATSELTQVMNLVRAALQAKYDAAKKTGDSTYVWFDIEAMYADRVIVCKDGRFWQFDYTIDASNNVQLAEPKEVIEQFLPVKLREALQLRAEPGELDVVLLAEADSNGGSYDAIFIRAGLAKNAAKTYYPDAALREAVPLFNDVQIFAVADDEHLAGKPKSSRSVEGWTSEPRFVEGREADTSYIAGRVNLVEGAVRTKISDAWRRGKKNLVALSIDATGKAREASMREAKLGARRVVQSFHKIKSVDIVTNASAGGALVRLVEAADPQEPGDMKLKELMLATIKEKKPALFATINAETVTDPQLEAHYREALSPAAPAAGDTLTRADLNAFVQLSEARGAATRKINATTLPAPIKEVLVARFNRLERFTEADVDTEIKSERELVVRVAESLGIDKGKVQLETADISVGDRSARIADMLDAFFDPKHKNHRAVHSFRECYIEMTGDKRVSGRIEDCDRSRLRESLGDAFREGIDTGGFGNVLGSSLNRRLVNEYGNVTQFDAYQAVSGTPVPLADFRNNERVRFGGFGDLPIVAQSGAYLDPDTPTDEKASYAAQKRGRTISVTLEAIKNDDVGFIRRIPVRGARSAKRTLSKFVLDFVVNNPVTTYDGVAWFHAGHANLGAAALDATSVAARSLAMMKQTEKDSLDRLNLTPKSVLVPLDLKQTAWDLFRRGTNLDKNYVQDQLNLEVVPVWYWTDTNDWGLFADPNDAQTFELGFLDNQQEPQLFVQDMPNVGSMFSNDQLTYKLRHIYGGTILDHRGADKSVV